MPEPKTIKAIDIELSEVKSAGVAYYRLPDHLFDFLKLCQEKHGIVGFEWDGSRNFGVIIKNE